MYYFSAYRSWPVQSENADRNQSHMRPRPHLACWSSSRSPENGTEWVSRGTSASIEANQQFSHLFPDRWDKKRRGKAQKNIPENKLCGRRLPRWMFCLQWTQRIPDSRSRHYPRQFAAFVLSRAFSIIRPKLRAEPVACRQIGLIDFKSLLCFHFDSSAARLICSCY